MDKMGKVLNIPPAIPKSDISSAGTTVEIKKVRVIHNITTALGKAKLALGLEVQIGKELHSHLFGLDDDPIAGSVGRLLVSIGIDNTDNKDFEEKVQELVGKKPTIKNIGGKLYWTP